MVWAWKHMSPNETLLFAFPQPVHAYQLTKAGHLTSWRDNYPRRDHLKSVKYAGWGHKLRCSRSRKSWKRSSCCPQASQRRLFSGYCAVHRWTASALFLQCIVSFGGLYWSYLLLLTIQYIMPISNVSNYFISCYSANLLHHFLITF